MAEFSPFDWTIDFREYTPEQLEQDAEVQATFLHEYTHYIQMLTGTLGRQVLVETTRLLVLAAANLKYGNSLPNVREKVSLRPLLDDCAHELRASDATAQYTNLTLDVGLCLTDIEADYAEAHSGADPFVSRPIAATNRNGQLLHIVITLPDKSLKTIPLSDKVLCENMARQVQRRYLLRNNIEAVNEGPLVAGNAPIDDERTRAGERAYTCLHDALAALRSHDDVSAWTIAITQLCIMTARPADAFAHCYRRLRAMPNADLPTFCERMYQEFRRMRTWDDPPLEAVLREDLRTYETLMPSKEAYDLHAFADKVAAAHNAIIRNFDLFGTLDTWGDVLRCIERFGSPPVVFKDEERPPALSGRPLGHPWHDLYQRAFEILWRLDAA